MFNGLMNWLVKKHYENDFTKRREFRIKSELMEFITSKNEDIVEQIIELTSIVTDLKNELNEVKKLSTPKEKPTKTSNKKTKNG